MEGNLVKSLLMDKHADANFLIKEYHPPKLEILGDLRSLTLGTSGGSGESGNFGTHYDLNMGFTNLPTP